jgi:uncharacterized RDD family membrane protein YckC
MKTKHQTLQGHYAGFITRSFAFIIDVIIVALMLLMVSIGLSFISRFIGLLPDIIKSLFSTSDATATNAYDEALPLITLVVNVFLVFGYYIFFWTSSGQTLGKALMGVRVVSVSGRPLTFFQALFRFLLYPVSAMFFFLGFFWVLADNQRQGWHDNLARTYVIYAWRAVPHSIFLRQWQTKWKKMTE